MPKKIFDKPGKKREKVPGAILDVLGDPLAARVAAHYLKRKAPKDEKKPEAE